MHHPKFYVHIVWCAAMKNPWPFATQLHENTEPPGRAPRSVNASVYAAYWVHPSRFHVPRWAFEALDKPMRWHVATRLQDGLCEMA